MKRRFGSYRRLARGFLSCSSLWVSEANVLYVCGSGVLLPFAEEYHRFDLRRIQSISVVRTYTGLVLSIILATISLGFGGLGLLALVNAVSTIGPEKVFYYIVGVPFAGLGFVALALLVGNMVLGPTCQLQIQTAARIQKIRAARRLRVGQRVLAELAPILARAQMPAGMSPAPVAPTAPLPVPLMVEPTPG